MFIKLRLTAAVFVFISSSVLLDKLPRIAQNGQDIAEYAVMLAEILVIVVGSIRLIGSNANNVFSTVSSSLQ